ncbi:hypothetical protein [Streptomyces sp. OK228]|uniref:hypothetical protein n=1 Tax=Streptomyces sp. OK228 TaxID=1882786 RepID=UPI000BC694EE|nr:hypothetical protein [Streptomyces sp. OK228]SOE31719.1 hypothetical protein SAMN05442782_8650 [Streptomyces sp. OK228]
MRSDPRGSATRERDTGRGRQLGAKYRGDAAPGGNGKPVLEPLLLGGSEHDYYLPNELLKDDRNV